MISIIVPVYKSEKTLTRCVESIRLQTFGDFEVILVVDGPPDGSGILAEKLSLSDARIRVINQENQGVSAARNRGIKEAKGEYIRFLDSDDYLEENSLADLMAEMRLENTDFVIAGFKHLYFGRTIVKMPEALSGAIVKNQEEHILQLYLDGYLNMPWNKLYKKELITFEFPMDLNLGEDLIFNLHYLLECKKYSVIQNPVCNYIQDDRGTTLSTKKREDKMILAKNLYVKVKELFLEMYPEGSTKGVLETKLIIEFLDEIEGLAFDRGRSAKEKKELIAQYYTEAKQVITNEQSHVIDLPLLDYKILYFFWKRKQFTMTTVLVSIRGLLVKVLKKR